MKNRKSDCQCEIRKYKSIFCFEKLLKRGSSLSLSSSIRKSDFISLLLLDFFEPDFLPAKSVSRNTGTFAKMFVYLSLCLFV